jgi:pullulanase/glycogen debranching enzyme
MRQRFCSEAPMARKCIIDTLKYWTKEYGVDGYPSISCR